jgi:sugar O-acyltransferase (sialic acid O-acetyltransferase NeuD family)
MFNKIRKLLKPEIKILGYGAQAKYVMDILSLKGFKAKCYTFNKKDVGLKLGNVKVYEYNLKHILPGDIVVICTSDTKIKQQLSYLNCYFPNIIHPKAIISKHANLGYGNIINAGSVIQPFASIENFCMIHANVIIEHDCKIDSFANIAPGAILTGWTKIGERSTVYSGSVVIPTKKIGKDSIVGANSVVLNDVPDNSKVYGIVK